MEEERDIPPTSLLSKETDKPEGASDFLITPYLELNTEGKRGYTHESEQTLQPFMSPRMPELKPSTFSFI